MYGAPPGSFNVVHAWVNCGKRNMQHSEKKWTITSRLKTPQISRLDLVSEHQLG